MPQADFSKVKTFDELQATTNRALSGLGYVFNIKWEIQQESTMDMLDTIAGIMMAYADLYSKLLIAGKVPPEKQIRQKPNTEVKWIDEKQ